MVHKIIVCHMLLTFFTVHVASVMKFVIPFSFFETSQVLNRLVRAALRNHNPLLKRLGWSAAVKKIRKTCSMRSQSELKSGMAAIYQTPPHMPVLSPDKCQS